jgi:hypothetical protein
VDTAVVEGAASLAAESIDILKSALGLMPADGGKHRVPRARRMEAYISFQRAAHEASVWPGWFGVLEEASFRKHVSPDQVMRDLAASRQATVALLAALSEIRMVGNPEPRRLAEEMVSLLVELMESRLPAVPTSRLRVQLARRIYRANGQKEARELLRERIPAVAGFFEDVDRMLDEDRREAQEARFNDCQLALGRWNRKFTLTARKDLGYGPRFWQRSSKPRTAPWQFWRLHDQWPGGWPPRDAKELVAEARKERLDAQPESKALGPGAGPQRG